MDDQVSFEDTPVPDNPGGTLSKRKSAHKNTLEPSSESEYPPEDEEEEGTASGSGRGSGGGPKARQRDDKTAGSARGSVAVSGAKSKADGDAKMTQKQQKEIMRAASVQVRSMSDGGDAMDKARSGQFNTLESEIKKMDGLGLYNFLTTNPSHMAKVGMADIQQTMINDGYGKQLDVLSHGTFEAEQMSGRKAVMDALLSKPVTDMNPAEQSFLWDKLSELGQVSGSFDGSIGALEAAVGGFILSTPAGEQMVKDGKLTLSGPEQKVAAPAPPPP